MFRSGAESSLLRQSADPDAEAPAQGNEPGQSAAVVQLSAVTGALGSGGTPLSSALSPTPTE
eukprot:5048973-Prymnesium_polylepis.1